MTERAIAQSCGSKSTQSAKELLVSTSVFECAVTFIIFVDIPNSAICYCDDD